MLRRDFADIIKVLSRLILREREIVPAVDWQVIQRLPDPIDEPFKSREFSPANRAWKHEGDPTHHHWLEEGSSHEPRRWTILGTKSCFPSLPSKDMGPQSYILPISEMNLGADSSPDPPGKSQMANTWILALSDSMQKTPWCSHRLLTYWHGSY